VDGDDEEEVELLGKFIMDRRLDLVVTVRMAGILANWALAKPIHFSTSGLCCGLALVNFAVKIALVFTVHLAKGALRACLKVLG